MGKRKFAIGIDLGTSTSEIAVFENGNVELISAFDSDNRQVIVPSAVSLSFNNEILVGERALAFFQSEKSEGRCIIEVKRKMGTDEKINLGDRTYTPQEISAFILKKLKDYGERYLKEEIKDIVLSVPAKFSDSARKATLDAAKIAGLNVLYIINEPTAAALAYGINKLDVDENVLVFDFGGGTLDITILQMAQGILDVKYSDGNPELGGKDIDELFMKYILQKFLEIKNIDKDLIHIDRFGSQKLKSEAEKYKKLLSYEEKVNIFIPNLFKYNNDLIDLELTIERKEFEKIIEPILEKAYNLLKQSIENSNTNPYQIKQVLLVGGTTYIPAIKNMIRNFFNRDFNFSEVNPDEAVARGAAIKAAEKLGLLDQKSNLLTLDVCTRTLGVSVLQIINNTPFEVIDHLILKNTKIPYSVTREYSLLHPEQESVEIKIYQGDGILPNECEFISSGKIDNIPNAMDGIPHKLIIEFSYNMNTIAEVKAIIPATNQTLSFSENKSEKRLNDEEILEMQNKIDNEWKNSINYQKYEPIINSTEELLNKIPKNSDDYITLNNLLKNYKIVILSNNQNLITESEKELIDYMVNMQNKYEKQ